MPDLSEQEINQPDHPEIEQQNFPEFERSTDHPQGDQTHVQSEDLRSVNADSLYKSAKDYSVNRKRNMR